MEQTSFLVKNSNKVAVKPTYVCNETTKPYWQKLNKINADEKDFQDKPKEKRIQSFFVALFLVLLIISFVLIGLVLFGPYQDTLIMYPITIFVVFLCFLTIGIAVKRNSRHAKDRVELLNVNQSNIPVEQKEFQKEYTLAKEVNGKEFVAIKKEKEKILKCYDAQSKYLYRVNQILAMAKNCGPLEAKLQKVAIGNINYRAVQHDSAIAGGIASALGGAGVGLAAAISTEAKNQQAKLDAEEHRKKGFEQIEQGVNLNSVERKFSYDVRKLQEFFRDVITKDKSRENPFTFTDCTISRTEGRNLLVTMKLHLPDDIKADGSILDGTLKCGIYEKGILVAEGYYGAPGLGEFNYKNAGFKNDLNISFKCPFQVVPELDEQALWVVVEPVQLWSVEPNATVFAVDNRDIQNWADDCEREYSRLCRDIIVKL